MEFHAIMLLFSFQCKYFWVLAYREELSWCHILVLLCHVSHGVQKMKMLEDFKNRHSSTQHPKERQLSYSSSILVQDYPTHHRGSSSSVSKEHPSKEHFYETFIILKGRLAQNFLPTVFLTQYRVFLPSVFFTQYTVFLPTVFYTIYGFFTYGFFHQKNSGPLLH